MDANARFFTATYSASHQRQFLELLEREEYLKAIKVLDNLPRPRNIVEEARRCFVQVKGYRHIAQKLAEAKELRETEDLHNEGVYF